MKLEVVQNATVIQPTVPDLSDEMLPGLHFLNWLPKQCQASLDEQGYKAVQNLVL